MSACRMNREPDTVPRPPADDPLPRPERKSASYQHRELVRFEQRPERVIVVYFDQRDRTFGPRLIECSGVFDGHYVVSTAVHDEDAQPVRNSVAGPEMTVGRGEEERWAGEEPPLEQRQDHGASERRADENIRLLSCKLVRMNGDASLE